MQTTMQFAPVPASARAARDAVRGALADSSADQSAVDTAVLLTSEIVTNAIQHARSDAVLDVHVEADVVRVEVTDDNPSLPQAGVSGPGLAERGRGLGLVDACASRWGVDPLGVGMRAGKTVWFEVAYLVA